MAAALRAGKKTARMDMIGSIYDAALDGEAWPAALEAVRIHIRADAAWLCVFGARLKTVVLAARAGVDHARRVAHRDEVVHGDPIMPFVGSLAPAQMGSVTEPLPFSRPRGTRFHCRYMKVQDKCHASGGPRVHGHHSGVIIGVQRDHDSPPFADRELKRLKGVVPHLVRALELAARLEQANLKARLADTVFGPAVPGMLLFDAQGRVVFLDEAAKALLAGQRSLTLRGGRLHARYRARQRWLDAVTVAEKRNARDATWEGSSARFTAFDQSGDIALAVLPWRNSTRVLGSPIAGAVSVGVLTPLDAPQTHSIKLLQSLFDLTPGEARLTEALVSAGTLEAAAQKLAIRISTARDRLKSVFRKTGFKSQVALVTAVLRSPTRGEPARPLIRR